jgi:hypothetical protein
MKKLENTDLNLPPVKTIQTGETTKKLCKQRRDQAGIHGYSIHPKPCNLEHNLAQLILGPLGTVVKAIRGPTL